jgi:hypothetical protein
MATAANLEEHHPALIGHYYRVLGSAVDTGALFPTSGLLRELAS